VSEPDEPFCLCPVHNGRARSQLIHEVEAGYVAFVGQVRAVYDELTEIGFDDWEWIAARDELTDYHPFQIAVVTVRTPGDKRYFSAWGNRGAYIVPGGYRIERNETGDICVRDPDTERHSTIAPLPVCRMN
jgi:hypothetical protein